MKKPFNFDVIILSKISFHRTRTSTHLVIEPYRTEPVGGLLWRLQLRHFSSTAVDFEEFFHCVHV